MAHRETRAHTLLPRKTVRICVTDDGSRLAVNLATWLETNGYSDVAVLAGGTKAWKDAGYVIFSGMNVPSKAFGEWVEHHYGTESVDPPELKQWIDSGRKMIVLDSRTQEEFTRMSIPTGIPMPGAELAYRIGDLAPDPDTLVVVNCAGRTRSIMAPRASAVLAFRNKVVALRNGTMGGNWRDFNASTAGRNVSFPDAAHRRSGAATREGVRRGIRTCERSSRTNSPRSKPTDAHAVCPRRA